MTVSAPAAILGEAPAAWPVAARGGAKRVVVIASLTRSLVNFRLELLKAMVAAGHAVAALAPDDDPESIAALARIGVAFRRVPMARTGTNPLADLRTLGALVGAMRALSPDLVLTYTMKPIIYGGIAARLAGVPGRYAMFTGFGSTFGDHRRGLPARLLRGLSVRLYRLALAGCTGAFVYNEADAADIRRHAMLGPDTPLTPVPGSGVDLDLYAPAPVPAGPPIFLLVARLLKEKGIGEFVEAARVLKRDYPDARFRILGPFDPNPSSLSPQELADWTADGAAEHLGEAKDVRPHLAEASVFVLPSYYREGIPRSALEALATGRAIVTTDLPGCREAVTAGENGFLVPPRDTPALIEAMRAFLADPGLAARMGARSRALAETRFDVHAVNARLIAALGLASPGPASCRVSRP